MNSLTTKQIKEKLIHRPTASDRRSRDEQPPYAIPSEQTKRADALEVRSKLLLRRGDARIQVASVVPTVQGGKGGERCDMVRH